VHEERDLDAVGHAELGMQPRYVGLDGGQVHLEGPSPPSPPHRWLARRHRLLITPEAVRPPVSAASVDPRASEQRESPMAGAQAAIAVALPAGEGASVVDGLVGRARGAASPGPQPERNSRPGRPHETLWQRDDYRVRNRRETGGGDGAGFAYPLPASTAAGAACAGLLAGITLAAVSIPVALGYAKIAGMPVVTGLYTLLIPMAVFAIFGSSRHLVVGADSATAAILGAALAGLAAAGSPQYVRLAGLAALLAGGLLLLAWLARLGFLANFLSRTVLIGFLTGVGIQVAVGQLPTCWGSLPRARAPRPGSWI